MYTVKFTGDFKRVGPVPALFTDIGQEISFRSFKGFACGAIAGLVCFWERKILDQVADLAAQSGRPLTSRSNGSIASKKPFEQLSSQSTPHTKKAPNLPAQGFSVIVK
ncbi:hypothetical protein OEG84_17645 [Hoeflea sp. G2-23]|uniref:Uncharacterized protein n=1 Tax=Hoeflea algicola TaxID=2983763 RepID=A0ABT3ZE12_9HYPH|nr:hypothetical protein [Hoeflea algicola]MCY0149481.1 hypothetical protein [Hoeflea algicola]